MTSPLPATVLPPNLDFLLTDFARQFPDLVWMIAVSSDGLVRARTESLDRDAADRFAAVGAGLASLLLGAGKHLQAGRPQSTMTRYDGGLLLVMSSDSGAVLMAYVNARCDVGQLSHAMAELNIKVGDVLAPAPLRTIDSAGATQ